MKISEPVKKETGFVGIFTLICCVLANAVFLCLGQFSYRVPIASAIGGIIGVLNFFLMALTVQRAAEDTDAGTAKRRMQASLSARTVGLLICLGAAVLWLGTELPVILSLLAPLLFPRFAIAARGMRLSARGTTAKNENVTGDGSDGKGEDDLDR